MLRQGLPCVPKTKKEKEKEKKRKGGPQGEELTGQIGVINGHVPAAGVVEDLDFSLVGFGNVGKVLLVIGVDILGIGTACLVAEVV